MRVVQGGHLTDLRIEHLPDAETVAIRAAAEIAAAAGDAVRERGEFSLAVSGGRTPARMFELLAAEEMPWEQVGLFQVDERIAPDGDPARNLTGLRHGLLDMLEIPPDFHPMPVDDSDLDAAAARYASALPPRFDMIHLGLGIDGHTASLVHDDPVLNAKGDVAITGVYQGYRRMTLTYPVLNRARRILWVTTGADKAGALARLIAGDQAIPGGRVARRNAMVLCDG